MPSKAKKEKTKQTEPTQQHKFIWLGRGWIPNHQQILKERNRN